ncbi:hypothetical protein Rsub_10359 [Raphidocelis subcapitata]|uniref:TNase-like domain-containing protein n=1 Tax=Raphidocelis subcapitata TaxID=307507 RepID=A0A2V0PDX9_9CHLO|nr:hypothetical protein Rsub_10359 [Raphidocelis subcapitata]|eukprot:GBF97172.1 hypothetical protein Rsub_10359 [Raphidocelis subcapitata]
MLSRAPRHQRPAARASPGPLSLRAAAAAAGVLSALLLLSNAGGVGASEALEGPARVVDGDTLYVQGTKIRLYAVDAPESKQSCKNGAGETYACGQQSADALKKRVGSNKVKCDVKEKDQYGRSVASCTILAPGGSEDMGTFMVGNGYAVAYSKFSAQYVPLERKAKDARIGIWQGSFTPPARWRYEQRLATIPEGDEDAAIAEEEAADRAQQQRPQQQQQQQQQRAWTPAPAPAPYSNVQPGRSYANAAGGGGGGAPAPAQAPAPQQWAPAPAQAPALQQAAPAPAPAPGAPRSYADALKAPAAPAAPAAAAPNSGSGGGSGCAIKGNIGSRGDKIYHLPGQGEYDAVKIETNKGEKYFCSEKEAQAAGFRPVGHRHR